MERDLSALRQLGQAIAEQQDAALRASRALDHVAQRLLSSLARESLQRLGRDVARAQDAALGQRPWRAAQARTGRTPRVAGDGRPTWRQLAVVGLTSGAFAVLLVWIWRASEQPDAPAPFFVAEGQRGQLDTTVSPAAGRSDLTLRFSDGAAVQLRNRTAARVRHLDRRGAVVALLRGVAEVAVPHRARTRWTLEAGPFTVHVVGTRFRLDWSPETRVFRLELIEGRVIVEGPAVARQSVSAGQSLTIHADQRRVEGVTTREAPRPLVAPAAAPQAEPSPSRAGAATAAARVAGVSSSGVSSSPSATRVPATPTEPLPGEAVAEQGETPEPAPSSNVAHDSAPTVSTPPLSPGLPPRAPRSAGPSPSPAPSPRTPDDAQIVADLLAAGRINEALDHAVRASWTTVFERVDLDGLGALADAARFARGTDFAIETYRALRRRFPGTDQAALAALSLGRLAIDRRRDYAGAVRWLALFLDERPRSVLAPVAAGRLLEAFVALGAHARACAHALSHGDRLRGGPYERLARDVLRRCPRAGRATSGSR